MNWEKTTVILKYGYDTFQICIKFTQIYRGSAFLQENHHTINNKNCIHFSWWCVFKDKKHNLHVFFYCFFFEFVCFPRFKNPQMSFEAAQIWQKITNFTKIIKNKINKLMLVFVRNPATIETMNYLVDRFYVHTGPHGSL